MVNKLLKKFNQNEDVRCIVCGHKISSHIDEGDGWRCHSILTYDLNQCECFLRKSNRTLKEYSIPESKWNEQFLLKSEVKERIIKSIKEINERIRTPNEKKKEEFRQERRARIDELTLLWSYLQNTSFIEARKDLEEVTKGVE